MSHYDERPDDLTQDTKDFLKSEYGQYIMSILQERVAGHLCALANIQAPYPDRLAAKYSELKEIIDLIEQPLDDDTPTRG